MYLLVHTEPKHISDTRLKSRVSMLGSLTPILCAVVGFYPRRSQINDTFQLEFLEAMARGMVRPSLIYARPPHPLH
jgi:hypothetical protein